MSDLSPIPHCYPTCYGCNTGGECMMYDATADYPFDDAHIVEPYYGSDADPGATHYGDGE